MVSLICGSLAFDIIMPVGERFSDALLTDQLHRVNLAFLVPSLRREYGGCAGNIAYNLTLLGADPLIMATLGQDGAPYLEHIEQLGISRRCIRTIESASTAQAFITTDANGKQITAFHPGAMAYSKLNKIGDAGPVKFAIITPDSRDGMLQHAQDCATLGLPFIFDPGQGLTMFNAAELEYFIELATYVTVSDYGAELLAERVGLSLESIAQRVSALLVTRGERGVTIFTAGQHIDIPGVSIDKVIDPTGCGGAFCAGVLHGLAHGMDWGTTGRLATLMSALKMTHQGPQNHKLSLSEIEERFKQAFGYRL